LIGVCAGLALAGSAAASIVPDRPEFLVSRTPDSRQWNPVATFGPGGISLVVWEDTRYGIRGQFYDPSGAKRGAVLELAANQVPPPSGGEGFSTFSREPALVFLAGGEFMVAWAQESGYLRTSAFFEQFDIHTRRVMARRFQASGEPAGPAFPLAAAAGRQSWPKLHALPNGQVLAAWRSEPLFGEAREAVGLFARRLTRLGRPLSEEVRLSRDGDEVAQYLAVGGSRPVAKTGDIRSHIILAWEGCCDAGGDLGIYSRIFDVNELAFGPLRQINRDTAGRQRRPAVAADGERGFLVLFQSELQRSLIPIFGQFVDFAGEPTGDLFQVSHGEGTVQLAPGVAPTPSGGFLAIWRDWNGPQYGLTAVEFDGAGTLGTEFRVNNRRTQQSGRTSLAADGEGGFLVPWETVVAGRQGIGARRLRSE
jgi:hypothetical protein